MPLRVSFDLADDDLKHFKLIMQEARQAADRFSAEEIIDGAHRLLSEVRTAKVPSFIRDRLESLQTMIEMVTDDEWQLPADEVSHVINALAYFAEAEDLIPDHIPGLGFLDDAIMVELVVRELKHEIDAYRDFCTFRAEEESRRKSQGASDLVTREEWLATRRAQLHSRMRRRRRSERRQRGGPKRSSPFSLF